MTDEWSILGAWIAEIASNPDKATRKEVEKVREEFLIAQAGHTICTELYAGMIGSGAARELLDGVWKEHIQSSQRKWGHLFSNAADLQAQMSRPRRRQSRAGIDGDRDRRISILATCCCELHRQKTGQQPPLKPAILHFAEALGVTFEGTHPEAEREALYKRIKRKIDDPSERIAEHANFRLSHLQRH